ncbi:tRNA (guanosine(46)-N7)-methyltransferase TrmB [Helicobacter kayseriensis]|uniref:tRNA (guanosine(46)-N7)-methyltransferase TrmB n=1 Tax=Helicobacter kayseriensis TaxID=2905877 RepID=UPI001E2DAB0E|nr:tRNA (guanosine(46)-N7)-methyltransferase TrmB [Helicobacter kayseriensis]MCE3047576.1 tRNA (guanosine(46)-N7)-methyltransferase TrmB [Helicobacter kayseriensis]MCE3048947.1 tRNA (guanosine(46)-N7)-methyltransferase TrmB [Helicobacter kayseriensis]
MPHCLAKELRLPPLPFVSGKYEFVFEAQKEGDETQSLILVRFEEHEFFLRKRYRQKQNDYILKCEKGSKNLPTGIIKGALRVIASYNEDMLITHNLNNDSLKQTLLSPFLKQIHHFSDFHRPFELEIGFGSGRHLLNKARQNPSMFFIGIEIHTPSIEQVLRQIEIQGIENVWIINFDARVFLELLPSSLCQAIYIHFPVPWEKKPHRRVWSERFLHEAMRILDQDGKLELRSDDEGYFLYALEIVLRQKHLQCKINKNLQKEVVSKYEDRWLRQHKDIYDLQVIAMEKKTEKKHNKAFIFPAKVFLRSFDKIPKKVIKTDWFLHIDSFYTSSDFSVLMVSFGDFNQPQSKFLLIPNQGEPRYLGGNPLPTEATHKAHQELLRMIQKGEEIECSD